MVVVEPMVLQILVVMTMLVLAVVMPRWHGSQVLPWRQRRG